MTKFQTMVGVAAASTVALLATGCGASNRTAATVTVTSTLQPVVTQTVTYTPPPPPGPKSTIETEGIYLVGTDILPGTYREPGGTWCYWARLRSLDTGDVIDNTSSDGPQVVEIHPGDKAFHTRGCAPWTKID